MDVDKLVRAIDNNFAFFEKVGRGQNDPAGVDAVRKVRDQMVRDLEVFSEAPSKDEVLEFCRKWRMLRVEPTGRPGWNWARFDQYPPDFFIECVVPTIEASFVD
jgi:hypothetical protein